MCFQGRGLAMKAPIYFECRRKIAPLRRVSLLQLEYIEENRAISMVFPLNHFSLFGRLFLFFPLAQGTFRVILGLKNQPFFQNFWIYFAGE